MQTARCKKYLCWSGDCLTLCYPQNNPRTLKRCFPIFPEFNTQRWILYTQRDLLTVATTQLVTCLEKNHPALWFQHWQAWPDRAQRKETLFTAGLAAGVLVVLHVAQRFYYTSGVVNPKVFSEHAFFEDSSTTYTFGVIFPCLRQLWKFNPGFSTSQERMDFMENLLGDNVQKHSEAWRLACWFAAIHRYTYIHIDTHRKT